MADFPEILESAEEALHFEISPDIIKSACPGDILCSWRVGRSGTNLSPSSYSELSKPCFPPAQQEFLDSFGLTAFCILSRIHDNVKEYPHQDRLELYLFRRLEPFTVYVGQDRSDVYIPEELDQNSIVHVTSFVHKWNDHSRHGATFVCLRESRHGGMKEASLAAKYVFDYQDDQGIYRFANKRWRELEKFLRNFY